MYNRKENISVFLFSIDFHSMQLELDQLFGSIINFRNHSVFDFKVTIVDWCIILMQKNNCKIKNTKNNGQNYLIVKMWSVIIFFVCSLDNLKLLSGAEFFILLHNILYPYYCPRSWRNDLIICPIVNTNISSSNFILTLLKWSFRGPVGTIIEVLTI